MPLELAYVSGSILALTMSFLALVGYRKLARASAEKQHDELQQLRNYHERLRIVLSELLAKANEVDQQTKFIGVPDRKFSDDLKAACTRLTAIYDALPVIEKLLEARDVRSSRKMLLESTRVATHVSGVLDSMQRDEQKLITRQEEHGDETV